MAPIGAPFFAELQRREAEIDAGRAELVSADDVLAQFRAPAVAALFDSIADASLADIADAVRQLDDEEPAGVQIERRFAGRVTVKPQFQMCSGRELRKAFRAAER